MITNSTKEFTHKVNIERLMMQKPGRDDGPLPIELEERRAKLAAFQAMFGNR